MSSVIQGSTDDDWGSHSYQAYYCERVACVTGEPMTIHFSLPHARVDLHLYHATTMQVTGPLFLTLAIVLPAMAQVAPTPGAGSLNTQVSKVGNVYQITQGTKAGPNLFHSFDTFSISALETAQFQTVNLIADQTVGNVLSRVTGGSVSSIFGTINSATYYPNANLFLMNPAGVIFGPAATLNIGGMATFTTADYLKLSDGTIFNASPNAAADALLSAAPVASFGFLGSKPAAILIEGSHLTVAEGTGISLVGGDITIKSGTLADQTVQPAKLAAPGGQINLVSVAGPGEVATANYQPASSMALGLISMSEGSSLDVSAESAGSIRIRGGQFELINSSLNADTGSLDAAQPAIDIELSGTLSISSDTVPALTARSFGSGNAGSITVSSPGISAVSTLPEVVALIDTHTEGSGNGGDITLNTGKLTFTGNPGGFDFFVMSGTAGEGNGGHVTIHADSMHLKEARIDTGDAILGGLGSGGHVTFTGGDMTFELVSIATDSLNARGGNVLIDGRNISIVNGSQIGPLSLLGESTVTINARNFALKDGSIIFNQTASGTGGGITITAENAEFRNGSRVFSQTSGDADAGFIKLSVTGNATFADTFDDPTIIPARSGLFTNSIGDVSLGTHGNAGAINVSAGSLTITGGARIDSTTQTNGNGGAITITAKEGVSIIGERPLGGLPERRASGIYTSTVGSELCTGPCGNAGSVTISGNSLNLGNGGTINSDTTNSGIGGNVTVHAANTITISGTMTDGTPSGVFSRTVGIDPGSGSGGNISLIAGQSVNISDGASVSASSTGSGPAGNINITAGNQFTMANSSVTTEANQSSGGIIKITTDPSGTVQLTNSTISASVLDGTGGGGSVNIDPQFVILQNSQILAEAVQGPGGNINVTITNGGLFLPDSTSRVSASSEFGQQGTVTIQAPIAPAGGKIQPLGAAPLQVTALLSQRCAAMARGEVSSFVVAGRDTLPIEPGGWLTSPLANTTTDGGLSVQALAPGLSADSNDTAFISLRRLPSQWVIAHLRGTGTAENGASPLDWLADCES
ncbi:MAG: protein of unknown function [Nitrospira sp.]